MVRKSLGRVSAGLIIRDQFGQGWGDGSKIISFAVFLM
jgi:hypothetical protein